MNFHKCLEFTLQWEGGFVDHPRDPGGATNMGITKKTWEDWVGHSVTVEDIKALTIDDINPVYRQNYWNVVHGDQLPDGLDLLVFDFAVNSGPRRSVLELQRLFPGLTDDGVIGPITLGTVLGEYKLDPYDLIDDYCQARGLFLEKLDTFDTFGRGWMNRVEAARKEAKGMV